MTVAKYDVQQLILNLALCAVIILMGQLDSETCFAQAATAPQPLVPVISIKADHVTAQVSPSLYGLMTEEINFSYEGGLYGELLRNRTFKADPAQPRYWTAVGPAAMTLDSTNPLNDALNLSLKLDVSAASQEHRAGISNAGYWGIPVTAKTAYHVSFYAKASSGFHGNLRATLESADGQTILGTVDLPPLTGAWKKYEADLWTNQGAPSKDNRFSLTTTSPGTVWLQQVSLFPPTYHHRANGNRPDLMQILAEMKPQFLRFPGGNYLEGDTLAQRFDWKKTIGDTSQRPGHESPWGYWSTDGLGLLEFLEWCEDLHMQPLLAVYAGYSLKQDRVAAGPDLQPYVQDALDEIEYVTGDAATPWGARRAQDGHPVPFPLTYIEVGNEDGFDHAKTYGARFAQFYDAIKARYPKLQIISTIAPNPSNFQSAQNRMPDLVDEHLYPGNEGAMESRAHEFDTRARTGPKIFVGEWATRIGGPTTNMTAALADAAWMTGMERNSDLVVMQCYAPLLVNVSRSDPHDPDRSMQWASDLIGYDASSSYGSPSYYAQKMFSTHHGDTVLAAKAQNIPTWTWQLPAPKRNGVPGLAPPPRTLPSLFFDATRDSHSGTIYLKIVNRNGTPQPVKIVLSGAPSIASSGEIVTLQAGDGAETNTLQDPTRIVPVSQKIDGLSADFTHVFPPYSISVLEMKTR